MSEQLVYDEVTQMWMTQKSLDELIKQRKQKEVEANARKES